MVEKTFRDGTRVLLVVKRKRRCIRVHVKLPWRLWGGRASKIELQSYRVSDQALKEKTRRRRHQLQITWEEQRAARGRRDSYGARATVNYRGERLILTDHIGDGGQIPPAFR